MSSNEGGKPSFASADEGYAGLVQDESASAISNSTIHLVSGGDLSLDEGEAERMLQYDEETNGTRVDGEDHEDNHAVEECKQVLPRTLTLWDAVAVVVGIQM